MPLSINSLFPLQRFALAIQSNSRAAIGVNSAGTKYLMADPCRSSPFAVVLQRPGALIDHVASWAIYEIRCHQHEAPQGGP